MSALFFYGFLIVGLGGLYRVPAPAAAAVIGLRLALGAVTLVIGLFLLAVLFRLPITASALGLSVAAAAGCVLRVAAWHRRGAPRVAIAALGHPAIVLSGITVAAAAYHGGIDYLPLTHDEFSTWLGNPVRMFVHGGWAAAFDDLYLNGYLPGWHLLASLSWPWFGGINFGHAMAAMVLLHIAVLGLIFEGAVTMINRVDGVDGAMARLLAWLFLLLLLAAEAMGPLWSRTVLIEPPQIYTLSLFMMFVVMAERSPVSETALSGFAGMALAAAYIIKSAAILFLPGVMLIAAAKFMRPHGTAASRLWPAVRTMLLLGGPSFAVMAVWSRTELPPSCFYSPMATLTPDMFATALTRDPVGLAGRFAAEVGAYVGSYKLPVTIAAGLGLFAAVWRRQWRAPLALVIMGGMYLGALYWYHLTCFTPYHLENLNSVPRFTRVVLQVMHAAGLVLLLEAAVSVSADRPWSAGSLYARLSGLGNTGRAGVILVPMAVLFGWQIWQLDRSLTDMAVRNLQRVDPRVAEMRHAAQVIARHASSLPEQPLVVVLSQGGDSAVEDYGRFYALSRTPGSTKPRFRVFDEVSWKVGGGTPNAWMAGGDEDYLRRVFTKADVIWPTNVTPQLADIVGRWLGDQACAKRLLDHAIVRSSTGGSASRHRCIPKRE